MASTGKKGKKSKGKTVTLNSFLAEQTSVPAGSTVVIPRKTTSWGDEVEEEEEFNRKPAMQLFLPTAPRAARSSDIDEARIPKNPPYVAYLSNLSYDVEQKDITDFFQDLHVTIVRLPKDERSGRLKGFGYVEFGDRNSFVQALQIYETTIKGRRIRIEVADNNEVERRRGGDGGGGRGGGGGNRDNRDRDNSHDENMSKDWRSGPRSELPPAEDRRGPSSGARREYGAARGFSGERDNRSDTWRDNTGREKRFQERPSAPGGGGIGGGGGFSSRRSEETSFEPKTRPKLQLKPRTLPIEEIVVKEDVEAVVEEKEKEREVEVEDVKRSQQPIPAASIFGAAKPVDTAAREREIEERLAKEKKDKTSPVRDSNRSVGQESNQDNKKLEPAPEPKESVWVRRAQRAEANMKKDATVKDEEDGGDEKPDRDRTSVDHVDDDNENIDQTRHEEDENGELEKQDVNKDTRDGDDKENDRLYRPPRRDELGDRKDNGRNRDRGYRDDERDKRERRYNDREGDRDKDRRFIDRDVDRRYNDREGERRYNDRESDRDRRYNERDGDRDRDRRYNDREGDRDRDRRYNDREGDRDRDRRYNDREGDRDRRFNDREGDRRYNDREGDRDRDRRYNDREGDRERRNEDRDGDRDRKYNDRVRDSERKDDYDRKEGDARRQQDRDRRGGDRRQGQGGKPTQTSAPRGERDRPPPRKSEDPIKMPKLKEADAPNYVATNKYSFLGDDDVSE